MASSTNLAVRSRQDSPTDELLRNPRKKKPAADRDGREAFDNIYFDLSKDPGKCRIAEQGLGWKQAQGDTFTLDKAECVNAQWSRASRGHELKIYTRNSGVVLLDGFKSEVS